jgi:hypothetical protein
VSESAAVLVATIDLDEPMQLVTYGGESQSKVGLQPWLLATRTDVASPTCGFCLQQDQFDRGIAGSLVQPDDNLCDVKAVGEMLNAGRGRPLAADASQDSISGGAQVPDVGSGATPSATDPPVESIDQPEPVEA